MLPSLDTTEAVGLTVLLILFIVGGLFVLSGLFVGAHDDRRDEVNRFIEEQRKRREGKIDLRILAALFVGLFCGGVFGVFGWWIGSGGAFFGAALTFYLLRNVK